MEVKHGHGAGESIFCLYGGWESLEQQRL